MNWSRQPCADVTFRRDPCGRNVVIHELPQAFRRVYRMRTVIIVATVALGAMRLVLRALGPPQLLELAEWTADE